MTRLFLPILVMLSAVFFSCSSSGDDPIPPEEVLITLTGEVVAVPEQTYAPVLPGKFTAQVVASTLSSDFTAIYKSFNLPLIFEADKSCTISPAQYYPDDGVVYFKGYAPTSGVRSGNTVTFSIDGGQDILLSNEVSGSKATPTPGTLLFQHKLSQLNISIKSEDASVGSAWGDVTVKAINENKSVSMEFISGVLSSSSAGEILVGTKAIATGTTPIGTIMVCPLGSSSNHELKLTGSLNPDGLSIILDDLVTVAGKAYNVIVTLHASGEITFTATQTEWKDGGQLVINPN